MNEDRWIMMKSTYLYFQLNFNRQRFIAKGREILLMFHFARFFFSIIYTKYESIKHGS